MPLTTSRSAGPSIGDDDTSIGLEFHQPAFEFNSPRRHDFSGDHRVLRIVPDYLRFSPNDRDPLRAFKLGNVNWVRKERFRRVIIVGADRTQVLTSRGSLRFVPFAFLMFRVGLLRTW